MTQAQDQDQAHRAPFDRQLLRQRRNRAARQHGPDADFLFDEVAHRMADRLHDVSRSFPHALDLGSRRGLLSKLVGNQNGIERWTGLELSPAFAAHSGAVVGDEEFLPFKDESFDLVISNLALHWVNDLPGALIQANHALKPDGLFLASLLGGETLRELRDCLLAAEAQTTGGAAPRVSPFMDVRDAGGLLQRAGFALPVTDIDTITVTYENAFKLLSDLRGMGEANVLNMRSRTPLRRDTLMALAEIYQQRHAGPDGRISARFDVIYLTGWAPHPDQPKPARPGSAKTRLADALGVKEISTGEKAG